MNKIYYVVQKETDTYDQYDEVCLGNKTITVYTIADNRPTVWFELYISNDDNTEKSINEHIFDNHSECNTYGEFIANNQYELIQL